MRKSIREIPSQPSVLKTVVACVCASARICAGRSSGSSTRRAPAIPSLDPMLFLPCRLYFSLNERIDDLVVTGISVTDATASSNPATDTFTSRRLVMNGSIRASTSYSNTRSTPALSSLGDFAVDTPALDPRLHGFTITGQPSLDSTSAGKDESHAEPRSSTARSHETHGTIGTPA